MFAIQMKLGRFCPQKQLYTCQHPLKASWLFEKYRDCGYSKVCVALLPFRLYQIHVLFFIHNRKNELEQKTWPRVLAL